MILLHIETYIFENGQSVQSLVKYKPNLNF